MKTFTTRIVIAPNYDGYHYLADYNDRKAVMELLHNSSDGDDWANRGNTKEFPDDTDWDALSEEQWKEFTQEFFSLHQRGNLSMEAVNIILPESESQETIEQHPEKINESIDRFIGEFDNGEERYVQSPMFHATIVSLAHGTDPFYIIDFLLKSFEEQQQKLAEYMMKNVNETIYSRHE